MEALEEFGLSKYETKVYTSLLSSGISTVRSLAIESQVPTGRIYDVLSKLVDKKLVVKQNSRPMKYLPVEPRLAMKVLLERKSEEMQSITEKARQIEEDLIALSVAPQDQSLFWSVNIVDKLDFSGKDRIAETEKELVSYFEVDSVRLEMCLSDMLSSLETKSKLAQKGVNVKLLVGTTDEEKSREKLLPLVLSHIDHLRQISIRITSSVTTSFDVIDEKKVIVWVKNPSNPDSHLATIYIWQKELAEELHKNFCKMWDKAREFKIP